MTVDSEKVVIVQQLTGCSEVLAKRVIRRLAEYEAALPVTDNTTDNRFNISTQTAATLCGVVKHTFLKYAIDYPDELPYVKIGNKFRFCKSDVRAFISRRITSTS